jgi:Ca2+-binding EF-hand superfamily protein
MPGFSIRQIFNRIDGNKDNKISKKELKKMAGDAGLDPGGFLKVDEQSGIADAFLDKFDSDKNKNVSWKEFQKNAIKMVPANAYGPDGKIDEKQVTDAVQKQFSDIDKCGDGKLSSAEIQDFTTKKLEQADVWFPETKAKLGTKVAVHLLDADKDGALNKDEVMTPVKDAVQQLNDAKKPTGQAANQTTETQSAQSKDS